MRRSTRHEAALADEPDTVVFDSETTWSHISVDAPPDDDDDSLIEGGGDYSYDSMVDSDDDGTIVAPPVPCT